MTHIKTLFFTIIMATILGCSSKTNNKLVDNKLADLLEKKDYFKLKDELIKNEKELTPDRVLFYNVFISKAFGDRQKSNSEVAILFERYYKTLNDTTIVKLLDVKAANYLYLYEYKKASLIYEEILGKHSKILDSTDVADYKNVSSSHKCNFLS